MKALFITHLGATVWRTTNGEPYIEVPYQANISLEECLNMPMDTQLKLEVRVYEKTGSGNGRATGNFLVYEELFAK